MSEPGQLPSATAKRPRPVISCLECRRKKLKCDRTHPCQQCIKIGRPGRCEYQSGQEPEVNVEYSPSTPIKRPRLIPPTENGIQGSLENANTQRQLLPPPPKQGVIEDLQERVARLEHALLAQHAQRSGESIAYQTPPDLSATSPNTADYPSKVGDISSQFEAACTFMTNFQNDTSRSDIIDLRKRLKDMHYSVEIHHNMLQTQPVSSSATSPGLQLPPYHICEKLAVIYFDNMEHCFRILHWPEFKNQLKTFFTEGLGEAACRFGFTPQLMGVLAIGMILGSHHSSEAATSSSIIKPAQALAFMKEFLQGLKAHQKYLLPVLQVKMLLVVCSWLNLDPMDDLFRLSGELLRDALVMKLDKDPTTLPGVSIFEGELRRRNWMTIIEVDIMLSILCKMPCMVPPYTSRAPQNINDEEIFDGMEALPQSRPMNQWTSGLCQYVLAQSFPQRLAACQQADSASHIKIQDVLSHTRFLEKVLQELPPPLRFSYTGDEESNTSSRLMARMEFDISIRRPLMHLYSRCALAPNADDIQHEIRAGFLQSCLMITTYQDLFDPRYSELNVPRPRDYWDFFYNCYRQELCQATLGLCLEIKRLGSTAQTNSPASNTASTPTGAAGSVVRVPSYSRESLIQAVRDTLEPMKRRLAHPGAKLKDIFYYNIILTSLLPEQTGQSKDATILEGLHQLFLDCQAQLERSNVPIFAAASRPESTSHSRPPGQDFISNPRFDPSWNGFPDLEIFREPEFGEP